MYKYEPGDADYLNNRSPNINKSDPFPEARKKSQESGKVTPEYIKQRQKDYREYGTGYGISMMGNAEDFNKSKKKKFGKKGWRS